MSELQVVGEIRSIARLCRVGDVGEAATRWNAVLQDLQVLLPGNATLAQQWMPHLKAALASMEAGDWVAFADALEFGLADL